MARALAADPPVLLMDEPFSAVDPLVRASLQDELITLQAELHKTIVLVTHDIEEAIKVGDMVALFRADGRLAQVGTPERLLGAPADDYVDRLRRFRPRHQAAVVLHRRRPGPGRGASARGGRDRRGGLATGEPWVLVTDRTAGPAAGFPRHGCMPCPRTSGWTSRRPPFGHTFAPAADSLRAALDAAVLSPPGRPSASTRTAASSA